MICASYAPPSLPPSPSPPPSPPSPPSTPPWPPGTLLSMTHASAGAKCELTNGGTCISDLNYTNSERCTFRAEAIISVSATYFETAGYYDWITIGDTRYYGTSGPSNVLMAAGETIAWFSSKDPPPAAL